MTEVKQIARAIVQELLKKMPPQCAWVNEARILQEIPLTKNQLEKFRANGTLDLGYHYKVLGKEESKDGSSRGRKTILYHLNNMITFVDRL